MMIDKLHFSLLPSHFSLLTSHFSLLISHFRLSWSAEAPLGVKKHVFLLLFYTFCKCTSICG